MHYRTAAGIVIIVISSLLICGCGNQKTGNVGQRDLASARALVKALDDNNLSPVQNQCGNGLQRQSATWLPAVSKVMNQQFDRAKDLSLVSSEVPAQGLIEQTWSVQAERQNYQMRVSYLSSKIRHLEFRTMPSQPWTHVTEIARGQTIK